MKFFMLLLFTTLAPLNGGTANYDDPAVLEYGVSMQEPEGWGWRAEQDRAAAAAMLNAKIKEVSPDAPLIEKVIAWGMRSEDPKMHLALSVYEARDSVALAAALAAGGDELRQYGEKAMLLSRDVGAAFGLTILENYPMIEETVGGKKCIATFYSYLIGGQDERWRNLEYMIPCEGYALHITVDYKENEESVAWPALAEILKSVRIAAPGAAK